MATARPNVPGSSLRSGHSVPKFSMLVSPSTNQVSSSTLKDKSKAQMVSKNVHMSASRSSQGFPNAKSTTRSQTTHNEQTNVSAPGSATSLSNRNRQHPYGCSKQETTKAGTCSYCILVLLLCEFLIEDMFFITQLCALPQAYSHLLIFL